MRTTSLPPTEEVTDKSTAYKTQDTARKKYTLLVLQLP